MNTYEVSALLTALDDLIDIKMIIRKSVPDYLLDEDLRAEFQRKLDSLSQKLNPIFKKYLGEATKTDKIERINTLKESLFNQLAINNALISSNSSKKRLKNIGIDPRRLIVSGGPIYLEDYKLINPKLTDSALDNIKNKIERVFKEIESEDWGDKDLFFLYEPDNPTDQLILNRLEVIVTLIGKKVKLIEITNWKDLDSQP